MADVEVLHPAVVQLAADTAAMRDIRARQWPLVAAALAAGATVEQVAEACDLSYMELRDATYRWMNNSVASGSLSSAQWAELSGLLLGEVDRSRTDVAGE